MPCLSVQATLTELRRKTGLVMGPVMHGGKTVEITSSGRVVAQISPRPRGMSGKEFARLWRDRPRLGPELAGEILEAIEQITQADDEAAD